MLQNLAVFASGTGSTVKYLLDYQQRGLFLGRICLLITDKMESGAAHIAAMYKVPICSSHDPRAVLEALKMHGAGHILLAGYLRKVDSAIINAYEGRIYNTHPSLLPRYGGKGMFGRHVHAAVFAAKEKQSGITIHEVNENYDEGKVLSQKVISIDGCRSASEVENLIKAAEKSFLLEWLNKSLK